MRILILISLVLSLAFACGSNSVPKDKDTPVIVVNNDVVDMGVGDGGPNSRDMTVVVPDAMMVPGGPSIIELSTNVTRLTQSETVVISALVTDEDGVDDILGGRLLDPTSGAVYGNFAGSGGSYTFDLSWDAIHQVSSIDFATEATRVFTVEFLDTMNNRATRSLTLTLHCDGQPACDGQCGQQLCDGVCQDGESFMFDRLNCGRCGNACQGEQQCSDGQCSCPLDMCGAECVNHDTDPNHCGVCNRACDAGDSCVDGECMGHNASGPCTGPDDCPGGQCFDENTIGIPGGVCAYFCQMDGDCPGTSRCATYMQGLMLCAQPCTSSAQCRDGFSCTRAEEGFDACAPGN